MKDCYQKNLLIKNKMVINNEKINLKNISMPLLNVMAEFDHLVPNEASIPLNDAVSAQKRRQSFSPRGILEFLWAQNPRKRFARK